MQAEILKIFITHGIKAKIRMTDGLIGFLPEENQEKAKLIRHDLMKAAYGAMGEILNNGQQNEEANKSSHTKITID